MIYLAGIDHSLQFERTAEEREKTKIYADFLQKNINLYKPRILAEEYSKEALKNFSSSTLRIANENNILHLFCDPETPERKRIGYKQSGEICDKLFEQDKTGMSQIELEVKAKAIEKIFYFPLREECWFKKLYPYLEKDIIFCCGDFHLEDKFGLNSLQSLLNKNGVKNKIIVRGLGVSDKEKEKNARVLKYIEAHLKELNHEKEKFYV